MTKTIKMKKTTTLFVMILFAISIVAAAQPMPHAFEGEIVTEDGSYTNMKLLTARIDGAVTASTNITGTSYKIVVVDNTGYGGIIEFFIGDEKAFEAYPFKKFETTKTNLTFKTAPEQAIGSCGDGICAVEECSFCAIDCPVSKCNNNNACDSAIGEDLVTAPNDCSVCGDGQCTGTETESSCAVDCKISSGSSSSGGSGGGSSSGSSTKTSTTKTSPVTITSSISTLSIDELNEEIEEPVEPINSDRITGFAILDFKNHGSLNVAILIVLAGLVFFIARKKSKKKANKEIALSKTEKPKKEKTVKKSSKKEIWKKGQSPVKKKSLKK